jgi:hypothetical protein
MKIRPVGAEFFHADGQTYRYDEASSRFSQFSEKRLIERTAGEVDGGLGLGESGWNDT